MSSSPQLHANTRIPRFRLTETTPPVLRFENGLRVAGELHVISCNGGLLLLPAPAHQGSVVGLVFHTQQGTGGGHSTNAFAYQQHTAAFPVHCAARKRSAYIACCVSVPLLSQH